MSIIKTRVAFPSVKVSGAKLSVVEGDVASSSVTTTAPYPQQRPWGNGIPRRQQSVLNLSGSSLGSANPDIAEVTRLGITGTNAGSNSGNVDPAKEKTDIIFTGDGGNNQVPAVPGIASTVEMTFGDPNSDGNVTIDDTDFFEGYINFIDAGRSVNLRTYMRDNNSRDEFGFEQSEPFNATAGRDSPCGAKVGVVTTIEELRDVFVSTMNNTLMFSAVYAKAGTTDTLVAVFKEDGPSNITSTLSGTDISVTTSRITTGAYPVGGDGEYGTWEFDFGGSWTSSSTQSEDDYFLLNAPVAANTRFNGGWSGGGEIASGTGYTTAGTYTAAQTAALFAEGITLNTRGSWGEFTATVYSSDDTKVLLSRTIQSPGSISINSANTDTGSGTLAVTELTTGLLPTGTGVYGELTTFSVTLDSSHASSPITGSFSSSPDKNTMAAEVRTAVNAATTTDLTVQTGSNNVVELDSDVVGDVTDITVSLTGGTNSTASSTVSVEVQGADAVVRKSTAYTITASSNHSPSTVSSVFANDAIPAEALAEAKAQFVNNIGGYTTGTIGSGFFDVTNTVPGADTPDLDFAITEAGTGGDLVVTDVVQTQGTDGTPGSVTITGGGLGSSAVLTVNQSYNQSTLIADLNSLIDNDVQVFTYNSDGDLEFASFDKETYSDVTATITGTTGDITITPSTKYIGYS